MNIESVNEVIACLGKERTLFHYYKDRYSIGLLQQYVSKKAIKMHALKQSPLGKLTQKPRVKDVLANLGNKPLDKSFLQMYDYDSGQQVYSLTLSRWGTHKGHWREAQITRRGYNLVLQLNFNQQHDTFFKQLGIEENAFNGWSHPVSDRRNTLAWARIDVDWHSNCALIEEVQNDWLRRVAWLKNRCLQKCNDEGLSPMEMTGVYGIETSLKQTIAYCDDVLSRYQPTWAEGMLWATIQFLWQEIGIREIFYHTEKSGKHLKHIDWGMPPQSIYTDLPSKFCFVETKEVPTFLLKEKVVRKAIKHAGDLCFQKLTLAHE